MTDLPEDLNKELLFAFKEVQGSSGWSLDRNRPYDGQPHTCQGFRGKTLVVGLTMRDICDCIVRGFMRADGGCYKKDSSELREGVVQDDLYQIDLSKLDPVAVIQNAACEIEKMMGIFPNVPKLKRKEEGGDK